MISSINSICSGPRSLRSGTKNQLLNDNIDYSKLNKATSHVGHAGSNNLECYQVWELVKIENPEFLKISLFGKEFTLKANWSTSGKSVTYFTNLTEEELGLFPVKSAINKTPSLQIDFSNIITVSNGKNSSLNICPSLITIL